MKRFTLAFIFALFMTVTAFAVTKSQVVVYINGQRYYIHTVESKETIYSISRTYNVDEQTIIDLNSAELKAGEKIKIPYETTAKPQNELSMWETFTTFSKHKIKAGETLYSISRKYKISIDTIIEDNPSIDPIALPEGYKLLIRKKMKGKSSATQSKEEWENYSSDLNSVTKDDEHDYHITQKGETIYSLSKQFGISEQELIELNNLSEGLKAGAIIKIPTTDPELSEANQDEISIEHAEQVIMRSLKADETLKVALLLPLSSNGKANHQFSEFYNGFVAGLDSVKTKWGRNIELSLYNTQRDINEVERVVNSEQFEGTNLIVGPIYENLLAPVVEYAEEHNTPVVSPLATLKESHSSVLFQLAPPHENKYNKVKSMLADTKHITLIYTENVDKKFESSIFGLIGDRAYDTHTYEYEHPSVVAQKIKKEEESAGDLSKFINNGKDNTIVVMSSSETDVDRILSALSSAQINIVARGGKTPKYKVLGNSDWSRYKNIDRTILFKNNVVLVSSYHTKRDDNKVKRFDSNYIKSYGTLPSLYSYRGFDAAMIFGEGLYSEIDYNLEGRLFTPLQSTYRFKTNPESGIHINSEWVRVNYTSAYTIEIE